jgi:hypothetical protein
VKSPSGDSYWIHPISRRDERPKGSLARVALLGAIEASRCRVTAKAVTHRRRNTKMARSCVSAKKRS